MSLRLFGAGLLLSMVVAGGIYSFLTPPAASGPGPAAQQADCGSEPSVRATYAFLARNRDTYERAIRRARAWMDILTVDPVELREHGIKGKKKLVELLDAYYRLLQVAGPEDRPALMERIRLTIAVTYEDRYHDMLAVDPQAFKQDATSYLRAALLIERMGFDISHYRREIHRIHDRLNRHLKNRGPHQRQVFHWYYAHFDLEEPFPLGSALGDGLIAAHTDPAKMSKNEVYGLTHEIFAPYEYGERLDADPFGADEKRYVRSALDVLAARYIRKRDSDLLAELVSCIRYLRFIDLPTYTQGLRYLLESQNADGSWGRYERHQAKWGELVDYQLTLHTTTVAVDALTIAFHEPWNQGVKPPCIPPAPTPEPPEPVLEFFEDPE